MALWETQLTDNPTDSDRMPGSPRPLFVYIFYFVLWTETFLYLGLLLYWSGFTLLKSCNELNTK